MVDVESRMQDIWSQNITITNKSKSKAMNMLAAAIPTGQISANRGH